MKQLALGTSILLGLAVSLPAAIVSVSNNTSSFGTAAVKLGAPPAQATDAAVVGTGQLGFDEAQGVTVGAPITYDGGGVIASGTVVDSHMILLNKDPSQPGLGGSSQLVHANVIWVFDHDIIGVMSDPTGQLEANSTGQLGSITTNYTAPFTARGMESGANSGDSYVVLDARRLQVSMRVTQPGDWIRVVTRVPEPGFYGLLAMGLAGIYFFRRRRDAVDPA